MSEKDENRAKLGMTEADRSKIFDLLKLLSDFCSPLGFEGAIRDFLVDILKRSCHVETDRMGNVIASVQGTSTVEPRPKILLSAHMDEIGFMISFITKHGFLRIAPLGAQNYRLLLGQRVTVFSDKGEFNGVIAEKPVHLLSEDEKKHGVKEDEIFIDIGADSKKDASEFLSVGDYITFQRQCEWLGRGSLIACKAADDRAGVLALMLALEHVAQHPVEWDVIGVFSTQEEVGSRGIIPSAYAVDPDAAIVIDVTHATDYPGINKEKHGDVDLGRGPVIAMGPNLHPKLVKLIVEAAEQDEIPIQVEIENKPTGTDARPIQVTRNGVITALLCIPLRYMHTNIEVLSPVDVYYTTELLKSALSRLPAVFSAGL
jgi:endoglucanase